MKIHEPPRLLGAQLRKEFLLAKFHFVSVFNITFVLYRAVMLSTRGAPCHLSKGWKLAASGHKDAKRKSAPGTSSRLRHEDAAFPELQFFEKGSRQGSWRTRLNSQC
ncbi:hypothetical protein PUN28_014383 [Cardiocondyla obscurior]|uniref:Uncharacterized protein n=1 Tax=Cardiocondyla obscurior TaxID=286306 RepID=A0AAW2EZW8_9HYME